MSSRRYQKRVPSSDDDDNDDGLSSDDGETSAASSLSSRSSRGRSSGSEEEEEEEEEEEHRHWRRKQRKKPAASSQRNTLIIFTLLLLILAAVGVAAYFYLDQEMASGSLAEGGTAGSGGGGGAGAEGSAGTMSMTSGTKTAASPAKAPTASLSRGPSEPTATTATGDTAETANDDSASPTETQKTENNSEPEQTASSPASDSGTRTGKKGVGYNKVDYANDLEVDWGYSWNAVTGEGTPNFVFLPMLWGEKLLDGWEEDAKKAIEAGATHVLGFNEPDLAEQANMDPTKAAELWKAHIEPLKNLAKLVSPAVSNGVKTEDGKPMGVPWLMEFLAACSGCTIDAVALHWYDCAENTAYFAKYLEESHTTLGKDIWLTEFMGTGEVDKQTDFVNFAVDYLEKQDWIKKYAAFGAFSDNPIANFLNADGALNDLGRAYKDAK
ncbi:hypothetical protein JCM11251_000687 [Rhodosporidiobolus azoricus]